MTKEILSDPKTLWTRFFSTYYSGIVTPPETEILRSSLVSDASCPIFLWTAVCGIGYRLINLKIRPMDQYPSLDCLSTASSRRAGTMAEQKSGKREAGERTFLPRPCDRTGFCSAVGKEASGVQTGRAA